ncbi:hypothetical protein BB559_001383 [Furculomyces boomerangus]|uniref:N-acetyltransferase domain-containing protein n=2 Tax=Harpellales TaxID=61421 RepID=A0A2T9Z292_9FUNG|nr:hypothetical protein BB559_001383 [Furculomyces boomerangus]PVZ98533.1 hypothetical protein BB558_005446 [Smittium angustum]
MENDASKEIDRLLENVNLKNKLLKSDVEFIKYEHEDQLQGAINLITTELSEPYSIYTYRYFVGQWPELFFLAQVNGECAGVIISRLEEHGWGMETYFGSEKNKLNRGYIAMLAVSKKFRNYGIGKKLVQLTIEVMRLLNADEVVLETEVSNQVACNLYQSLGFVRDKSLSRYYLGGSEAYRLKLWL